MQFKVLCVGDVVGKPGRSILARKLPALSTQHEIDCVIVNAENAAEGSGLTVSLYDKFMKYGVDVLTMGDHVYRKNEIIPTLETSEHIVRPANLPRQAPGREMLVYQTKKGYPLAVCLVLGRLYMKPPIDCPFHTVDRLLRSLSADVKMTFVEIHAEATSEKIGMGWHLDGRASVVYGTHTHVQTADERVLPRGTGDITDLGMTGPHESVLGRRKDNVLRAMISGIPAPFHVAQGDPRLHGIVVTLDTGTGRCRAIERIQVTDDDLEPASDND